MNRDAIDFGKMNIPRLFIKLFFPTFMGLLFGAMFNIADGIFVGRGVGSDALAAVNIAAPIYMVFTGIALMFGAGVSVVAAVHLSRGNVKAANINVTQALTVSLAIALVLLALLVSMPQEVNRLFGGSERLAPYVTDYLRYVSVGLIGTVVLLCGLFVIRLDGSPRYAMMANVIPATLNIVLDWLMVFPLGMGIKGAALATSISELVGMAMVTYYLLCKTKTISLYRPKFSSKALRLTMRNAGYMVRLGFPTFLSELAMTCTMIVGNYMFMSRLHEDGVAAFSVACYLFPLVFMFGNAVAQSSLPIISYNHGLGNQRRIRQTLWISVVTTIVCGLLITLAVSWGAAPLMHLFLSGEGRPYQIGVAGLPLFALSFVFFSLNVVLIGYYQSIERARAATLFTLLRGYVLVVPIFVLLPSLLGDKGLWLAVPLSELITCLLIVGSLLMSSRHRPKAREISN